MTARGTWKTLERSIGTDHGGRRIPVTGIDRDGRDAEDGAGLFDDFQAKYGKRQPGYLRAWLDGIRGTAQSRGRVGVVIWKAKRAPLAEAVVLVAYEDWVALHGHPRGQGESQ